MNIEEENQAPAWLRQLRVTKIALVDRGANQHAHITLYKHDLPESIGRPILPEQETDMNTTVQSQSVIFDDIKKRATKHFPELTEPVAIDRFTTELEEGRVLARQHSEAVVDFEPQEVVTKQERIGGDQAELIAKRLDDAAREYSLLHGCGRESAYDHVLASSEGQQLRKRYDQFVRG